MDWSRLGDVATDALVVSFLLGAVLSPPDPLTQLLYAAPTFLMALAALYLYGQQSVSPWWRRYLLLLGGVLAVSMAWRAVAFAVGLGSASVLQTAFTLAGVAFGAWLAYLGGWAKLTSRES
ncbi:hypothetical protein [Halorussus lipolyticus]|uniref:hypothetical protein n=1 Tax=Halorussus lipolyticus TaxID=3034024 RepID=UPI0023E7D1C3|nr:hypothetical protein [Halorussus sp. DT80]